MSLLLVHISVVSLFMIVSFHAVCLLFLRLTSSLFGGEGRWERRLFASCASHWFQLGQTPKLDLYGCVTLLTETSTCSSPSMPLSVVSTWCHTEFRAICFRQQLNLAFNVIRIEITIFGPLRKVAEHSLNLLINEIDMKYVHS